MQIFNNFNFTLPCYYYWIRLCIFFLPYPSAPRAPAAACATPAAAPSSCMLQQLRGGAGAVQRQQRASSRAPRAAQGPVVAAEGVRGREGSWRGGERSSASAHGWGGGAAGQGGRVQAAAAAAGSPLPCLQRSSCHSPAGETRASSLLVHLAATRHPTALEFPRFGQRMNLS